jgi:hypothetical protein
VKSATKKPSSSGRKWADVSVPAASNPASRSRRVLVPTPQPTSSTRAPGSAQRRKYETYWANVASSCSVSIARYSAEPR